MRMYSEGSTHPDTQSLHAASLASAVSECHARTAAPHGAAAESFITSLR